MCFSILHISDIHRDLTDEVENEWLLGSLNRDFEQFSKQDPKILKPSVCIVSGDLVYGADPYSEDPESELKRQYSQAKEFLEGLADQFFDGDRECIVILPGNHDVSFNDVMSSVRKIEIPTDSDLKKELVNELFRPNSKIRWSWNELCFYEIVNDTIYNGRFRHFAEMYQSFYQNKRKFSLVEEEQYQIFDFPHLNFSIIALNSCFNNDPFHSEGSFNLTAINNVCKEVKKIERVGWLIAASWHHNITGGPTNNDYLDIGFLQPLIDAGISIAFHGHQHFSDCIDERYRLGTLSRKMTIISASTLCAEPKYLVQGIPRSYNIIELNSTNWTGRIHQRRMVNTMNNMPIWGPGQFIITGDSYFDFKLCPPMMERPPQLDLQLMLENANQLIESKKFPEALDLLLTIKEEAQSRPFLVKTLEELGNEKLIISTLWPPLTNREAIILGGAILECGTKTEAQEFINLKIVSESTDSSVCEIRKRVIQRYLR